MPDEPPRPGWRRPAVLLAIALDVVVFAIALMALASGFSFAYPDIDLALRAIVGNQRATREAARHMTATLATGAA